MNFNLPKPYELPERPLGERVADRLKTTLGIDLPERPDHEMPTLPPDLTNVDSRALGELATRIGIWAAFLSPRIIIAKGAADELKTAADWAKKIDKDERKALELTMRRNEKKVEAELTEALYKSVMRMKETVSREIARIEGDQLRPPVEPEPPPWRPQTTQATQPSAPPWAAQTNRGPNQQ